MGVLLSKKNNKKKTKKIHSESILDLRKKKPLLQINHESIPHFYNKFKKPVFALVSIFLVISVFSYVFRGEASVATFFPTSCLGGWQNPEKAEGAPEVEQGGQNFSGSNSALLFGRTAEIFCGGFAGDINEESVPKKFTVKLSWFVTDELIQESEPLINLEPAQEPESEPSVEEVELPSESTTSFEPEGSQSLNGLPLEILEPLPEEELTTPPSAPLLNQGGEGGGEPTEAMPIEVPVETESAPEVVPVVEPAPAPEPTPAESRPQSFLDFLFTKVFAEDNVGGSDITETPVAEEAVVGTEPKVETVEIGTESLSEAPAVEELIPETLDTELVEVIESSAQPEDVGGEFVEVLYTLDGENWQSLQKISRDHWPNASFDITSDSLKSWEDLSKLQISIRALPTIDVPPVIYLDSIYVEVEYEDFEKVEELTEEDLQRLPRIEISGDEIFNYPKDSFTGDEDAAFEFNTIKINELTGEVLPKTTDSAISNLEVEPPSESTTSFEPEGSQSLNGLPLEILEAPLLNQGGEGGGEPTEAIPPESVKVEPSQEPEPTLEEPVSFWRFIFGATLAHAQGASGMRVLKSEIRDQRGAVTEIASSVMNEEGKIVLRAFKPRSNFRPGVYIMEVEVLSGNKVLVVSQEFAWGVLAINTNKAYYAPSEEAYIQIASLDSMGHTLCDSDLALSVRTPLGEEQNFATSDGTITKSPSCGVDNVTDLPDYFARINLGGVGTYTLVLKNLDLSHEITDYFRVEDSVPLTIERTGATRINPFKANYVMTVRVRAPEGFKGVIHEPIPSGFEIVRASDQNFSIYKENTHDDTDILEWLVDIPAGGEVTLFYEYKAPAISPEFYLLGPIEAIKSEGILADMFAFNIETFFEDGRAWQIASDAPDGTGMLVYDEDGANDTTPHYRTWSGSDLSSESQLQDDETASDGTNHTIIEASPTRDEYIMGRLNDSGHLDIQVWNGSSWVDGTSAPANGDFTTGIGTTNDVYRGFDIAYEGSTGGGMVVYESSSTGDGALKYRTWDGSAWSGEGTIDYSAVDEGNAVAVWVECEGDYDTDYIICAWREATNLGLYGAVWDGSAWQDIAAINTGNGIGTRQDFDVAWEGSGDGMVVYNYPSGLGASTYTRGSGWADATSGITFSGTAIQWVAIAGSPTHDHIAVIWTDVNSTTSADVSVEMWDGSAWNTISVPSEDVDINNNGYAKGQDVAWEQGGGDRALFVWRDGSTDEDTLVYMVYDISAGQFQAIDDGGTWCNLTEGGAGTTEQVTSLSAAEDSGGPCRVLQDWDGTGSVSGIQLSPAPESNAIALLAQDELADLIPEMGYWNGDSNGTWLTQTATMNGGFETDLSTGASLSTSLPTKPYDFAFRRSVDSNVMAWGTQATSVEISSSNNEMGGKFAINRLGSSVNVTSITISEAGTIDASTGLDNIELYYESDTSAPYDCASESYGGGEDQYGSTDTDGFSSANGTSTFTETVAITSTSTLCIYVIYDVTSSASAGETIEIQITTPSSDVAVSAGTVGPGRAMAIPGTTTIPVPPDALLYYGDLYATDPDRLRFQTYSDSGNSFGGQISTGLPVSQVGDIHWPVAKQSPTRNEQIIAFVQDGSTADLQVLRCTGDCNTAGDFSAEWTNAGVQPALACDTTAGDCTRAYDVGYEQLSGDAMVVYADNASATSGSTSKIYYCIWNGSAWSPSGCAPSDGSNDLPAITNFNGIPKWIRVIPEGEQLTKNRSDRILVLAGTDATDVAAWIWNGSNFTSLSSTVIANNIGTGSTPDLDETQFFDGAWETDSGDAIVLFGNSDTEDTTPAAYKVYSNSGNTWDGSESAIATVPGTCAGNATTTYVTRWVNMASSPGSDIIIAGLYLSDVDNIGNTPISMPYHWSGSAWTVSGSGVCVPSKTNMLHGIDVAFEKYNSGTEFGLSVFPFSGTALDVLYTTFTAPSTWVDSDLAFNAADDHNSSFLYASPNATTTSADKIHLLVTDWDCDLPQHRRWTGSAWDGGNPTVSGALPPDCTDAHTENQSFTWVNKMYSARQRNWRWTDGGTDTASTPTTFLASEITTPQVSNTNGADYRLRVQVEELTNGASEINSRKKLQYVSSATCADPNSCTNSNWTDVGDTGSGSIWRYVDLTCTATDCADGTTLVGTVLTGTSSTCAVGKGCGTWVLDGDAAAGANMDHNAGIAQEIEYIIENNGVASGVTYYFRIFDVGDNTVIYREHASDCGASSNATCTYPSLEISGNTISISGTCDAYDQTTNCGDLGTIMVAVNGTLQGQTDTGGGTGGTWSITGVTTPSSGDIITVFVDGAGSGADRAAAITKYDGTGNIDGIQLFKEHLTIGSNDTGATLTSAELGSYDNSVAAGDDDVFFDYRTDWSSTALTATGGSVVGFQIDCDSPATSCTTFSSQEELYIATGWTYRPDSAGSDVVVTHDVEIVGTLNMDDNDLGITGSFINSGTFTKTSGQEIIFSSTATGENINSGGSAFHDVTFQGSGGEWTAITSAITVDGLLTITAGNYITGAVNNTVTGTTAVTGTLTVSSTTGTKTFNGNVTIHSGGTWNETAAEDISFGGNLANNDTFTASTGTHTFTGASKIFSGAVSIPNVEVTGTYTNNNVLTVSTALSGSGTLAQAASSVLNIGGTSGISTLTATASNNTVNYTSTSAGQTVVGTTYHNLGINKSGQTATLGGNTVANGTVTITLGTLDTSGSNYSLTANDIVIANSASAVLTANASTITLTGTSGTLFSRGASGVFTQGTSEVVVASASGTPTLLSAGVTFHKLTINSTATVVNAGSVITMSSADAANKLYVQQGVLNDGGNNIVGTANGTLEVAAGATLCIAGTAASTNATCDSGAASTTPSRQFPSNYTNGNITLATTSTIRYLANSTTTISAVPTYGNLILSPVLAGVTNKTYTFNADTTINGDLTVNPSGAALTLIVRLNGGDIIVAPTKTTTITSSGSAVSTMIIRNSSIDYDISTGSMVIASGGTLDGTDAASTITVADDWTNNGTFTAGNTTVLMNTGTTATVTGETTFYNLTITHTSAKEVNFSTTAGHIIHVTNTFSATGSGYSGMINLYSTSAGTQWHFHPTGTASVNYVRTRDGGCESGAVNVSLAHFTNGGNNDSCWSGSTLTFSLSSNSINLGTLTTVAAGFASHTMSVIANTIGGFAISYNGPTLTNGAYTIPAYSSSASSPGNAGFGINLRNNTTPDVGADVTVNDGSCTVSSNYNTPDTYHFVASTTTDAVLTAGEGDCVYTVSYVGNISTTSAAGDYSTAITYVVTGTF